MDFKRFHCPVCNKQFEEADDVVVCPDCGTPHHRACYKSLGQCFNHDKHGSAESVEQTFKNNEVEKEEKVPKISVEISSDNENINPLKTKEEKIKEILKMSPAQSPLIEGKHTYLYEIAIGKNQRYYIPRFMVMNTLKKGISWNFVAFLAPLAWTLYRKMYKFSAIVLAIYMLIFGLMFYHLYSNEELMGAMVACAQEDPEYIYDIVDYLTDAGDASLSVAQQKLINIMESLSYPLYLEILSKILPVGIRIFLGLFGTKKYMQKLRKNIDKAEKKGLEGDLLKKYLYTKYGTLPMFLVAILGYFEFMILYNLIY